MWRGIRVVVRWLGFRSQSRSCRHMALSPSCFAQGTSFRLPHQFEVHTANYGLSCSCWLMAQAQSTWVINQWEKWGYVNLRYRPRKWSKYKDIYNISEVNQVCRKGKETSIAGCTVYYGLQNWPITAHKLTERNAEMCPTNIPSREEPKYSWFLHAMETRVSFSHLGQWLMAFPPSLE